MNGTPRKHIMEIGCEWINPEKYSAEEFEVYLDIPAPKIKIKLDLSSSCSVPTMTPDIALK